MDSGKRRDEPGWLLVVDPSADGQRLDRFIASRLERVSRARASRLSVTDLDHPQTRLKKSSTVYDGQRLWVSRPIPDEGLALPRPQIIFQDEQLLVLNKPAGLAVHPSASRFLTTVTYWLSQTDGLSDYTPAHRLDVETSGILICGRTNQIRR